MTSISPSAKQFHNYTTSFKTESIVRVSSSNNLQNEQSKPSGVSLSKRIRIGNLAACKILLDKLDRSNHRNPELKEKLNTLIPLIVKNRDNREPLSDDEKNRKVDLQNVISEEISILNDKS